MADGHFYLTTPIYYVNAEPHIGHAYTTIMADIIARQRRQLGDQVFFLTGTDEHGIKVARSAEEAGRSPVEHADLLSDRFRDLGRVLNSSHDFFIRTTRDEHVAKVREIVQKVYDNGHVYSDTYSGWYCAASEAFYTEDELGPDKTCPIHKTPVEWVEETNWFFRISDFRERLLAHYEEHSDWVLPAHRANEARRMIEDLEDLSISRAKLDWGVRVPWDDEQVIYVWVDALLNYVTALSFPDAQEAGASEDLWPADLQLMAKDILKFHAVIWPALLMAAEMPAPRRLFIHGYVLKGGEKMSKTVGNVIDPFPFIDAFGIDALRYYLAREIRFGEDGTFTQEGFEARYSGELANEFGNLLNRTTSMISRYRDGVVPALADDDELSAFMAARWQDVKDDFAALSITQAAEDIWVLVRRLNQLVEQRAPWKLAKDDSKAAELDQTLASLAEGVRIVSILLWPIMPGSCETALRSLGQESDAPQLQDALWGKGLPLATVEPTGPLFPKVEDFE
jgi:methionyl-tRNA synthetase